MSKELTKKEEKFLKMKTLGNKTIPYIIFALTLVVFCSFIYFFFFQPLIADPFYVSAQLKQNAIKSEISNIMTTLFPVLFLTTYLILVALISITYAYFRAERKFLNIIKKLRE